ncbi:MAG: HisA/HisF-related TIM barrel protein [Gammaproteobacteria bacterium]
MFSVIPAIDILAGECVRLVRGDYGKVSVFGRDPAAVAARFADAGFRRLHIVDLDAARESGDNADAVRRILQKTEGKMRVQVGGGLRTDAALQNVADAGADFMIVGTAAAKNRQWREKIINDYPGRIYLAVDIRGEEMASAQVAVSGWQQNAALTAADYLLQMRRQPPAAIVCTDINRDGVMAGPNLIQIQNAAELAPCPVIASGGVRNVDDVRALAKIKNVCAAVVGRALYDSDAEDVVGAFVRAGVAA